MTHDAGVSLRSIDLRWFKRARTLVNPVVLWSLLFAYSAQMALASGGLYLVTDLGPLGAGDARDLNDFGIVVGTTGPGHGYVFWDANGNLVADDGELIDLGALPGQYDQSKAYAISSAGPISGWSRSAAGVNHAVVWSGGTLQDLGPNEQVEGGVYHAFGVNSSGVVVGQAGDGAAWPARWVGGCLSYLWDPVGNTGAGNDINDAGQVVGWRNYLGVSGRFAFLLQGGTATNLGQLGGETQWAEATAISNFGYIVGWATATNGQTHAFLRTPHGANSSSGIMVDLGTFGGNYSAANGVNDRGQVVGVARNQFDEDRPFLYSNGQMVNLNSLLVDSAEWTMEIPYAINNSGQIVGLGHRTGQNPSGLLLTPNDSDGDGLFDVWEEPDGGIDYDADGTVDLNLYVLGARKSHKDLFIEVDAMVERAPAAGAIASVVAAFNAAPVSNPDGVQGIKLHVQVDETDVPRVPWDDMTDVDGDGFGDWPGGFDATKAARFGTTVQRVHPNAANILAAKRLAYRYCIFADTYDQSASSGLAELPGNDFMVTLGGWTTPGGTAGQQAGTFMHELGHALGLRHGGGDNINFKPNYHSVMSYTFQTPKNWYPGWQPVYSSAALPQLDETDLDEAAGIGGSVAVPVEIGPVPSFLARMGGAVDYNRDGTIEGVGVAADVNHVRQSYPSSPGQLLSGFNDWPAIIYAVTGNGDFAEGVHLSVVGLNELTLEDHEQSNEAQFVCDPCDVNCDGTVNGRDIDQFVEALTTSSPPMCAPCAGDANGDGASNESDILMFVECVMGA